MPISVSQRFRCSVESLWSALTDVEQMRQWFFDNIPDFQPKVGFVTRFNVDAGERQFMHLWRITDVQPLHKIVYDWRYEGYEGAGLIEFILNEHPDGSRLTVTAFGMESFPQDVPEFHPSSCENGWKYFIQQRLVEFINS